MLHHRTEDPGVRAGHIADREAEPVWQHTKNWDQFSLTWKETYNGALAELTPPPADDVITTAQ